MGTGPRRPAGQGAVSAVGARPCVRRPFTPGATTPQSCHPVTCGACLSRRLCSPRAPGSTRRTRAPGLLYSCGWPGTRNGPACKPRKSREHGGPAGRAARPKEARGPGDQGDRPSWQWGRRSRGPQREGLCVGEGAGSGPRLEHRGRGVARQGHPCGRAPTYSGAAGGSKLQCRCRDQSR